MKILLITVKSQISHGGIAVWTDGFLAGCKKKGIDVDIVNIEVVGKRLQNLNSGRNLFDEYRRTKRIFNDLKKALKDNTYSAVHLNTSCGTMGLLRDCILAVYIKKKGIPLVTHYHCDIPYWIRKKYSRSALKKLATLSDKNIVLCENSRKYLENEFDIESYIIPNFVDDSLIISKPKVINEELQKIVFVGRVSKAKGAYEIYELADRFPKITFELIGEVSEEFARLPKPQNVVLTGPMPHDDLIGHIDLADLFLFPSHSEGFSLALTEAMARGIPCIATDAGANSDMLSDDCGYVVKIGDTNSMEKAIKEMSYQKRIVLSKNAVTKSINYYTVENVVKIFENLYSMCN